MLLWVGCIAGALKDSDYVAKLAKAGFDAVDIEPTRVYDIEDARTRCSESEKDKKGAVRSWLERSQVDSGSLFRAIGRWGREATFKLICDHQLAKIIKALAHQAGLDPSAFSGHSLRSGLATSAAEGGATERSIMEQTRHKSLKQVRQYIRRGSLFRDNAAARSGL